MKATVESIAEKLSAWSEREQALRQLGQQEVADAVKKIADAYQKRLDEDSSADSANADSPALVKANKIRRHIEASEQHRTMCVEHGLGDAAIDTTYEIQALEKKLVELVKQEL